MENTERAEVTIHRMDDVLASQVAAGEVVERPCSVVKELVENSLDAGARSIRVEIRRGGISLIKVTDDGCGMSRQDAVLCLQRHATSKLRTFEDLYDIRQLGFRGEALPSVASVAELRITTRRAQDVDGVQVCCDGGVLKPVMDAGCAPGTEIAVSNLFFNTPVRRKFLKSEDTEAGHVEHQVKLHALAFPEVRFTFVRDSQLVFDAPATHDLRQRISAFTGRELADKLLRMKPVENMGVRVEGYLLPMSEARRNRKLQYFFLNGRPIEDKIVSRSVRDGYGGIPTGMHPAIFLYLEVDPGLVDVNVHPAKREVRFRRPSEVTTAIIDAVAATLAAHVRGDAAPAPAPVQPVRPQQGAAQPGAGESRAVQPGTQPQQPQPGTQTPRPAEPAPARPAPAPEPFRLRPIVQPVQQKLTLPVEPRKVEPVETPEPQPIARQGADKPAPAPAPAPVPAPAPDEPAAPQPGRPLPHFRFIGTLKDSYLIFENADGLVLVSPRAARERILFERLTENKQRKLPTQRLLAPLMLELDARDMGVAAEVMPQLEQAGFSIAEFGHNTLRVEAVPALFNISRMEDLLHELLRFFSSGESRLKRNRNPFEVFAIHLARQAATREDMTVWMRAPMPLLSDLLRCEIPYCTPGGKPTMLPFSLQEINRKFQVQ